MNEKDVFLASVSDKIREAQIKNKITCSRFMDLNLRAAVEPLCKRERAVSTFFWGGFEEAERVVALFVPLEFDINPREYFSINPEENPLALLSVKKDSFHTLSHRDYLGAVMSLGIERGTVGDILVNENGCELVVLKPVSRFLEENLTRAGGATLSAAAKNTENITPPPKNIQDKTCVVSSLRLDGVVAEVFSLSRTAAAEAIAAGLVFINDSAVQKKDKKVAHGDKLVLRGRGKAVIKETTGETRKGRLRLAVEIYL